MKISITDCATFAAAFVVAIVRSPHVRADLRQGAGLSAARATFTVAERSASAIARAAERLHCSTVAREMRFAAASAAMGTALLNDGWLR